MDLPVVSEVLHFLSRFHAFAREFFRFFTSSPTTSAPAELEVVLDVTTDEGLLWMGHFGEYSDNDEPIVCETHVGTAYSENCGESRECYRLTIDDAGIPVCRDCPASYDGVAEVREP